MCRVAVVRVGAHGLMLLLAGGVSEQVGNFDVAQILASVYVGNAGDPLQVEQRVPKLGLRFSRAIECGGHSFIDVWCFHRIRPQSYSLSRTNFRNDVRW